MSTTESTKPAAWTDKERVRTRSLTSSCYLLTSHQLTYLFALIENANVKFDYNVSHSLCIPHMSLLPLTANSRPLLALQAAPSSHASA